jgi:ABC-type transport system substrate-binding protein
VSALAFPVPIGTLPTPAAGTFRSLFPEFNTAPDAVVQSRLDQAQIQIDPAIWGDRSGEGQVYLAAHLLAISPGGQFARLLSKEGSSTYQKRYDEMVIMVAGLIFRVI